MCLSTPTSQAFLSASMARQWLTILDAAENWAHLRVGIHTRFLRWMTQHQQHLHLKRMDKTANFLFSVAWNTFVVFWRANSCGELSGRKRMLLNFLLSLSGKTHVSQSFHWLVGKKYGRRLTYCQVLLRNLFSWQFLQPHHHHPVSHARDKPTHKTKLTSSLTIRRD